MCTPCEQHELDTDSLSTSRAAETLTAASEQFFCFSVDSGVVDIRLAHMVSFR